MQVMAEKGLLVRNERYRSHVYDARFAKEKTQQQLAGNLLHRAFGVAKNLILGEIRRMLDEFEKGSK